VTLMSRARTLRSLLAEAWPTWLALGGLAGALVVGGLTRPADEARVRTTGMLLQLLGVGTVAVGLSQTRRLFGRASAVQRVGSWLSRLWSVVAPSRSATVHAVAAAAGAVALTGSARARVGAGPDTPLDRRVAILEENHNLLQQRVDQQEIETGKRVQAVRTEIQAERRAREAEHRLTAGKLEELAVGGLHLESVGVLWLLLGVIATSLSQEIAVWLCRAL
jgi:hypothetical protein